MKSKMIFFGILLTSLFVLGGWGILNKTHTLEQEENLENTELAIYVEGEKVDTIPSKGNQDGYVFDKASCYVDGNEDGSVTVSWDNDSWAPIVKGLSTYKTRCDLYFRVDIPSKIRAQLDNTGSCPEVGVDGTVLVNNKEDTNGYVCSAPDDYGTSYYFRGNVTNNYVKFGDYYWRIIRVNGDDSVRMIYDGTSAHSNGESSSDRQIGESAFNSSHDDNAYVGYMYGTTGASSYEETHTNTNNSTIKQAVDSWYKTNIEDKGLSRYVSDTLFCNDRSLSKNSLGGGFGTEVSSYRWYDNPPKQYPRLNCKNQNDRFTVNDEVTGNGDLTYPVGLVTIDEAYLAGGYTSLGNSKYYLYSGTWYWTMSPDRSDERGSVARDIYLDGNVGGSYVEHSSGIKPVINLKGASLKLGDGTASNPYCVE